MKFCSNCGSALARAEWPIECESCSKQFFRNPIPVAVCVVPVGQGVLTVRRDIEPGKGKLALPGGFMDWGETWQQAAVREVMEETGLVLDPATIRLLRLESAPPATLLVFVEAEAQLALPEFQANLECSELVVVDGPCELAFPLHSQVLSDWFAAR